MARTLTKKQRKFVNEYADTGNGTQSVIAANYDVIDEDSAAVVASVNLKKVKIQEELRKLGFDSNNAKRVISEILNDDSLEPKDRIKAAENVFKVHGDYAAEKHVNVNLDADITSNDRELGNRLIGLFRRRNPESI